MITRLLILIPACAAFALAEETPTPSTSPEATETAKPPLPSVSQIDENTFKIGEVTFNQKTREIRFPCKVNMTEGLIEYLIVLQQGKAHESLFITEICPTHLNLAFKLLRYTPSPELFSLMEDGHMTGIYPPVSPAIKSHARIDIEVEWNDRGTTRRFPINEWIQNSNGNKTMTAGPWLYTGADVQAGKFIPDLTGDIAAIMEVRNAMINYPGSDNGEETVWFPFPEKVPPLGTSTTLIITPHFKPQPLPKP
jgi:hypothetical protein